MIRPRLIVFVAFVLCLAFAVPASAQVGPQIEDGCLAAGGSARNCRGPEHLAILAATECRLLGGGSVCDEIDGYAVDDAAVAASSDSWIAHSLADQRVLDDNEPLHRELWAHTHNSFNGEENGYPTLYGTDPNQLYSIPHQLDMGIRAVEIDLHWVPSIHGSPYAVVVCHGTQIDLQLTTVHAGCLPTDPLPTDYFTALNAWLDEHPGEIVMLYLENQMQQDGVDSPDAHVQAAQEIQAAFGDKIYTPDAGGGCHTLPMDTSRAEIRDAGKQLIITGNCYSGGSSPWNSFVFDRGPRWKEAGLDYGDDFTAERCAHDRVTEDYPNNWIRHYGDLTGLSDNDPTSFPNGGGGDTTVNDATQMVRCGVNMIGFDMLQPFDARLAAIVWSWATDEPKLNTAGACAISNGDARFVAHDCSVHTTTITVKRKHKKPIKKTIETFESHHYACWDGTEWKITSSSERFSRGDAACATEGLGSFDVPRSGYTNELLRQAKAAAGVSDVFVNYAWTADGWTPGS